MKYITIHKPKSQIGIFNFEHQAPSDKLLSGLILTPHQEHYIIFLFTNFSVHIPSHPLHDWPADRALSNTLAVKE
jgi:hypothetical protein